MPQIPIHGSLHFDVREWVDKATWNALGVASAWMIDPAILRVADLLRDLAGAPVTVNNWHYAKPGQHIYRSSGYRSKYDMTGAAYSQHRCGRAGDFKVAGFSPSLVQILIERNAAQFEAAGLTTMENVEFTKTWIHLDVRPRIENLHPETGFLIVNP